VISFSRLMCDNGSDAPEGDAAVLKWHHQAADPMGVFSPPKKTRRISCSAVKSASHHGCLIRMGLRDKSCRLWIANHFERGAHFFWHGL